GRVDRKQAGVHRGPDVAAVVADTGDRSVAIERAELADDLGRLRGHLFAGWGGAGVHAWAPVDAPDWRCSGIYAGGSVVGSNNVVANPPTGAASHRRVRPPPLARTWPPDSSVARARCTLRWLVPSASASAEVDQASPSASSASSEASSPSIGGASTATSRT